MLLRAFLIASALLLLSPPASARGAVTLSYLPDPLSTSICPDQDFFDNEVQIRVGYELFQPAAPKHLTVKLERVQGRFHATAKMTDEQGNTLFEDSFSAQECTAAALHAAIAVSIVFALPAEPPPASAPASPGKDCYREPERVAPKPSPAPPPKRFFVQSGLAVVVASGITPVVVGGIELSLGALGRIGSSAFSSSIEIAGRILAAPSASVEGVSSNHLFTAGSISACIHYLWALGCAQLEAGSVSMGRNSAGHIYPSRSGFIGLGGRLGGDWSLSPFLAIRPYIDLMATLDKNRFFSAVREAPLWSSPPLSVVFGLGPVINF